MLFPLVRSTPREKPSLGSRARASTIKRARLVSDVRHARSPDNPGYVVGIATNSLLKKCENQIGLKPFVCIRPHNLASLSQSSERLGRVKVRTFAAFGRMGIFSDIAEGHERLKQRIHSTRIPLNKHGRFFMGCVYFGTPLVVGYFTMNWAIRKSEENLGPNAAKLRVNPSVNSESSRKTRMQNEELDKVLSEARKNTSSQV